MTIQLSHPWYSAQGSLAELYHLGAPTDHGPGRTCMQCGKKVNRYAPVELCDICRTKMEDEAGEPLEQVRKPAKAGRYTESLKRAEQRAAARRAEYQHLVDVYGTTVKPDTPAEVVRALIVTRVGTMRAAAALLGWSETDIRTTCTSLHRARNAHKLIPQWKCDVLTKFFEEGGGERKEPLAGGS